MTDLSTGKVNTTNVDVFDGIVVCYPSSSYLHHQYNAFNCQHLSLASNQHIELGGRKYTGIGPSLPDLFGNIGVRTYVSSISGSNELLLDDMGCIEKARLALQQNAYGDLPAFSSSDSYVNSRMEILNEEAAHHIRQIYLEEKKDYRTRTKLFRPSEVSFSSILQITETLFS